MNVRFHHTESHYLQHMVLNDSLSKMSGIELQVWKANKLENKQQESLQTKRPNKTYITCKCFVQGFLQVTCSNFWYIISSHYVQRGHRRGNEMDTYVGKPVSLSSCFFFCHHSYTDLGDKLYSITCMYQDYNLRSVRPFPSTVCNISWSSHRTFFPFKPCW